MIKPILTNYGPMIALGLSGNKEQIEQTFNLFYNYGAIANRAQENAADYLHWMSDNFAYFLSAPEKIVSALTSMEIVKFQQGGETSQFKGQEGGVFADITRSAQATYNSWERENFLPKQYIAHSTLNEGPVQ